MSTQQPRSGVLPAERPRKRLVRMESPTDPKYGTRPNERSLAALMERGVILLDKPAGPSSHQVAAWVREATGISQVGHGGTLDPNVTGLLPVCLGRGVKAVQSMLLSGKEYICVMRLHEERSETDILATAKKFTGKIQQMPPVRSAVKRRARYRRIYYLDVLEIKGRDVLFRVGCQAGTYIRTLCVDMAQSMGTRGHMQELRRSRTGLLSAEHAVSLTDVHDAFKLYEQTQDEAWIREVIQPIERVTQHMEAIVLRDTAIEAICSGASLAVQGVAELDAGIEEGMLVQLISLKGELVALGRATMTSGQMMEARNGIVADLERVIMARGTYPKVWKRS